MRLLNDDDLKSKGIKFSGEHRRRLIKVGKFPPPIKLGENRNAWLEPEIDAWVEQRIAERDAAKNAA